MYTTCIRVSVAPKKSPKTTPRATDFVWCSSVDGIFLMSSVPYCNLQYGVSIMRWIMMRQHRLRLPFIAFILLLQRISSFIISHYKNSQTFCRLSDLFHQETLTEEDDNWVLRSMTFHGLDQSSAQNLNPNILAEFLMEIGACSVSITDHDKDTLQEEPIFCEPSTNSLLLYNKVVTPEYWKRCDVISHFPGTIDLTAVAILVQATFQLDHIPVYSVDNIPDRDWVIHVQSSWKPIVVGSIILRFPWHDDRDVQEAILDYYHSGEVVDLSQHIVLQLEGGTAFGTGEHPTTRLCLGWIEHILSQHGDNISFFLDYGAGSGVLGMASCALGRKCNRVIQAVGIEIDADAILIANKNAENNQCSMITYLPSLSGNEDSETLSFVLKALQRNKGVSHLPDELNAPIFDACAMNILAGPLIMLKEIVAKMIRPGGYIGLSGILTHQAELVADAYREYFDSVNIEREDSGWVLITGIRRP